MQTAAAFGMTVAGAAVSGDPATPIRAVIEDWLPLSDALNAMNQSLGRDDLYPYVLTRPGIDKLAFADERVRTRASVRG